MPTDPHLGSDWDPDADTDPLAAIHALRRDLRRLEKQRNHVHEWEGQHAEAGDTQILVRSVCYCGAERIDAYATMDVATYGPMVGRTMTTSVTEARNADE
jgi:hypothetical protein